MAKSKSITLRIDEDWYKDLSALAGTFGVSPDEVARQSLPDVGVTRLFFQCKDYVEEMQWDEVANVGRAAIRNHLRAKYMEGLSSHMARLGVSMDNPSGEEVEAAKRRALDEMRNDTEQPLDCQIARAEQDSVYLGHLYEAWKRAKAGNPEYTISEVDISHTASTRDDAPRPPQRTWAILRNGQIV
jgi:hypothetical protein